MSTPLNRHCLRHQGTIVVRVAAVLLVALILGSIVWSANAVAQSVNVAASSKEETIAPGPTPGVAPAWPFAGFVVPELGRYWDTNRREYSEVAGPHGFGACRELYVNVDDTGIRLGYRTYENYMGLGETHYVIPWGDIAYPVIARGVRLSRDDGNVYDVASENQASMADRIVLEPITVVEQHEEGEGGSETASIVGFSVSNGSAKRWYRSAELERGFIEFDLAESPIEDITAYLAEDKTPDSYRWFFNSLRAHGTDGRHYGFSLYRRAHAACSSEARSFVVDGRSGRVVACLDTRMDRVTPLIFIESGLTSEPTRFELPSAPTPVGLNNCSVRLDGEHAGEFFELTATSAASSSGALAESRE